MVNSILFLTSPSVCSPLVRRNQVIFVFALNPEIFTSCGPWGLFPRIFLPMMCHCKQGRFCCSLLAVCAFFWCSGVFDRSRVIVGSECSLLSGCPLLVPLAAGRGFCWASPPLSLSTFPGCWVYMTWCKTKRQKESPRNSPLFPWVPSSLTALPSTLTVCLRLFYT